jgi:glycosyltransferase involved in cell wall biosynthesis
MSLPTPDRTRVSVVGTVGLPARYGGFETLVANLVDYRDSHELPCELTVYCSAKAYTDRPDRYGGAVLRYVPLGANGASSILYDIWSILDAVLRRERVILVLGVSGAVVLPLVRLLSRARLVVNIDGLEWKRPKWSRLAASFLRLSEWLAVRSAHVVVADNRGIVDHVRLAYGQEAVDIPYGGDHAVAGAPIDDLKPANANGVGYALMLCRIEPENHIHLILDAFDRPGRIELVAVGNWASSEYGRLLRDRYRDIPRIRILEPIFDKQKLAELRADAALYVHGHSAGGTNPALVEMMHFGTPVAAFDCSYNRYTTEDAAVYFRSADELATLVAGYGEAIDWEHGLRLREIARRRYTWEIVGGQYFAAMDVISTTGTAVRTQGG